MQLGWFDWLAFTIPSVMLFGIAYYFIKGWMKTQQYVEAQKTRRALADTTLPLKLQAYERLALFLERIKIDHIVLRMKSKNMRAADLANLVLLTVQQEYEHNMSQQVYVSEQLWSIIELAKNQNTSFVLQVQSQLPADASGEDLLNALSDAAEDRESNPLQTALNAIRTETRKYVGT